MHGVSKENRSFIDGGITTGRTLKTTVDQKNLVNDSKKFLRLK